MDYPTIHSHPPTPPQTSLNTFFTDPQQQKQTQQQQNRSIQHSSSIELIINNTNNNKIGVLNDNNPTNTTYSTATPLPFNNYDPYNNNINNNTPHNTPNNLKHTIRNCVLLFIFPMVTTLAWLMIPLQPPQAGFVNNWVFSVIAVGVLPLFSVPATAQINGVMLNEPIHYISTLIASVVFIVGWSLWVEFAPFPFPVLPNMVINTVGLSGMVVAPYLYSKRRSTPEFKKRFKEVVMSYNNTNNAFFMLCTAYVIGMLLVPNRNFQILLTAVLIVVSWVLYQMNYRSFRKHLADEFHFMPAFMARMDIELFSTMVFPTASEYWFFVVVFVLKMITLLRFTVLLSEKWWEWNLMCKNRALAARQKKGDLFGIFLGFVFPVSYTRTDFNNRCTENLCTSVWTLLTVPFYYVVFSLFMRHGWNKDFYFYSKVDNEHYYASLIYVACSAVGTCISFVIIYKIVKRQQPKLDITYSFIKNVNKNPILVVLSVTAVFALPLILLLQHFSMISWALQM